MNIGEIITALRDRGVRIEVADLTKVSKLAGLDRDDIVPFLPAIGLALLHDHYTTYRSLQNALMKQDTHQ